MSGFQIRGGVGRHVTDVTDGNTLGGHQRTGRPPAGVDQLARTDGLTQTVHAQSINQDRSITGTCMVPVLHILTDTGCVYRVITPPVRSM